MPHHQHAHLFEMWICLMSGRARGLCNNDGLSSVWINARTLKDGRRLQISLIVPRHFATLGFVGISRSYASSLGLLQILIKKNE
ncbi:hypothetical protein CEXT_303361 [Caerostris extrusa]|uniref:Uncharacterized protein n=1 Tax=Caerostris extrusa TaxID=172846 RepID=A0AAV4V966_CAEEX|nr:hypothetical protein CEXT_303361 [Caerostris extrusa]